MSRRRSPCRRRVERPSIPWRPMPRCDSGPGFPRPVPGWRRRRCRLPRRRPGSPRRRASRVTSRPRSRSGSTAPRSSHRGSAPSRRSAWRGMDPWCGSSPRSTAAIPQHRRCSSSPPSVRRGRSTRASCGVWRCPGSGRPVPETGPVRRVSPARGAGRGSSPRRRAGSCRPSERCVHRHCPAWPCTRDRAETRRWFRSAWRPGPGPAVHPRESSPRGESREPRRRSTSPAGRFRGRRCSAAR